MALTIAFYAAFPTTIVYISWWSSVLTWTLQQSSLIFWFLTKRKCHSLQTSDSDLQNSFNYKYIYIPHLLYHVTVDSVFVPVVLLSWNACYFICRTRDDALNGTSHNQHSTFIPGDSCSSSVEDSCSSGFLQQKNVEPALSEDKSAYRHSRLW